MSRFPFISFLKPRSKPVGSNLERGDQDGRKRIRRHWMVKIGLMVMVIGASMIVFPRTQVYEYTAQVDDIWRQDNLHAPFRFPILKTERTMASERTRIRSEIPPIFRDNPDAGQETRARVADLDRMFEDLFIAYGSFQSNRLRGRDSLATRDSLRFRDIQDNSGLSLRPSEWQRLLDSYVATVPGLVTRSRTAGGERVDRRLLNDVLRLTTELQEAGILDVAKDSVQSTAITVRSDLTRRQAEVPKRNVWGRNEALREVQARLQSLYVADPELQAMGLSVYNVIVQPNLIYDERATMERWSEQENLIIPNQDIVRQNEVIVRRGDIITEEVQRKLLSLEAELRERSGAQLHWRRLVGQFIMTLGTFSIFFLYLYFLRRPIFDDNRLILLITLLMVGVIGLYGIALRLALVDMYIVPVAVASILLTVMFDSRVALFGTITLALLGGHLLNSDFTYTFATIFAGTLGIFSVRDIRNRSQFFLSAGLVFLGYVLVLSAGILLVSKPLDRFMDELFFVTINAVLLLLAYPLLWVFERAFDVTTDLTLLELSDTNRPLLKELSLRAPGTFNHVLQVANMAEAASMAIEANALLTRVGALYHDIGKMLKPEYFVENQRSGINPHDALKPRMSALIIASHVKEGIELGKQYKLPQAVLDFIPMHHGTTRIEYFYRRALDRQKAGESEVSEAEFRYPGPKPNTKETSVLMLADSVEAASRALENPTHKRLENLIEAIVEARREDGQLDDTELTFADLRVIKQSFLSVLLGTYHVRVRYPGDEPEEPAVQAALPDQIADALNG